MNKIIQKTLISTSNDDGELDKCWDVLNDRTKFVEWLHRNSKSSSDWAPVLSCLLLTEIQRKKQENLPYEKEKEILNNVPYFFTNMASCKKMLRAWEEELKEDRDEIDKVIKQIES
ncbi:MAG: hypothetical protein LBF59_04775 [Prevotellaceae bacterium]|jgi:hypothetical protein|nr:hypothetical protein [Prevotellaceae bacterium]